MDEEDQLDEARELMTDLRQEKIGEENWANYLKLKEDNERMKERLKELKSLVKGYRAMDHDITFQLIREQLGL